MDNIKNDAYYITKMLKDINFIIEKTRSLPDRFRGYTGNSQKIGTLDLRW